MSFPAIFHQFTDWQSSAVFFRISKAIEDHQIKETAESTLLTGLFYPMKLQEIALKPEGMRAWRWWSFVSADKLELDSIIKKSDGRNYRVMAAWDYALSDFYQYELIEVPNV